MFSFVKVSAARRQMGTQTRKNATPTNETEKTQRDFGTESFAPGRCSILHQEAEGL
jgi:hypothetical protein